MKSAVLSLTLLLASAPLSANLVQPLGSATQVLVPAAGSTPGANGTFFRSEITILNYRNLDQQIQLFWIPQGGTPVVVPISLNARTGVSSQDFIAEVVGQSGLGSLVITAVLTGTNTIDTGAQLYVTSRIWTPEAGTLNGTNSQTFATVPVQTLNSTRQAMIGVRRDGQYRLNVGLVNLDNSNAQTLQITLGGSLGTSETVTVVVQPLSMQQISMPGGVVANPQILVENITPAATRSVRWATYASSIDNVTGDSWSVVGFERPDAP